VKEYLVRINSFDIHFLFYFIKKWELFSIHEMDFEVLSKVGKTFIKILFKNELSTNALFTAIQLLDKHRFLFELNQSIFNTSKLENSYHLAHFALPYSITVFMIEQVKNWFFINRPLTIDFTNTTTTNWKMHSSQFSLHSVYWPIIKSMRNMEMEWLQRNNWISWNQSLVRITQRSPINQESKS